MHIGILGAGNVAQAVARKALAAGHSVSFSNRRGPDSLAGLVAEFGKNAHAVTPAEAMQHDVVVLCVPWPAVDAALSGLPQWTGQILIDAVNAFSDGTPQGGLADLGGRTSSEVVASLAPGARVVKAVNSLFMTNFEKTPAQDGLRRVLFLSGDDESARQTVGDLFDAFGFAPIDLGSLADGGALQAVGGPLAGHDLFVSWPAPRAFPGFGRQAAGSRA